MGSSVLWSRPDRMNGVLRRLRQGLLAAVSKPSLIAAILKRSRHYGRAMDSGALNRDPKPT
jgi:hypothetical protein